MFSAYYGGVTTFNRSFKNIQYQDFIFNTFCINTIGNLLIVTNHCQVRCEQIGFFWKV